MNRWPILLGMLRNAGVSLFGWYGPVWWIPVILTLFYGWGLVGPYSLGKAVMVGLVGLWLSLGQLYERDYRLPLVYAACLVIAGVFGQDHLITLTGLWGTYNLGLVPALSLFPVLTGLGPVDKPGLVRGIRIAAVLMALYGLLQKFVAWPVDSFFLPFELPAGERVYSTIGSPVYAGAMVALFFPFGNKWESGILLLFLWATGSRGAYLAVGCSTIYYHWPHISHRWRFYGLLALLVGMIGTMTYRPPSDLGRLVTWSAAWDGFKLKPWLGWGPGNYIMLAALLRNPVWDEAYGATTQDHAHNLFLEAGATGGILGLIGLACLLAYCWKIEDRKTKSALLGFFIVGMLNPLPLIGKFLALAIVAVEKPGKLKSSSTIVKSISIFCLVIISLLLFADILIKQHGQYPWSFSSEKAAYGTGLFKEPPTRQQYKF